MTSIGSPEFSRLKRLVESGARNILFVCTGNVCRSPAAEYVLRHELTRRNADGFTVHSAGLLDLSARPADPKMVDLAGDRGIFMKNHRSRQLNPDLIEQADLIFAMEFLHRDEAVQRAPAAKDKIFLFSLLGPETDGEEISDPLGAPGFIYKYCFNRIFGLAKNLADLLAPPQSS